MEGCIGGHYPVHRPWPPTTGDWVRRSRLFVSHTFCDQAKEQNLILLIYFSAIIGPHWTCVFLNIWLAKRLLWLTGSKLLSSKWMPSRWANCEKLRTKVDTGWLMTTFYIYRLFVTAAALTTHGSWHTWLMFCINTDSWIPLAWLSRIWLHQAWKQTFATFSSLTMLRVWSPTRISGKSLLDTCCAVVTLEGPCYQR